jgi:hypothetical protein
MRGVIIKLASTYWESDQISFWFPASTFDFAFLPGSEFGDLMTIQINCKTKLYSLLHALDLSIDFHEHP